jgi:hypothetical protein
MNERVIIRKRPLEWWRESNEVPDTGRLEEAYDASRVKIGSDGRNGPDIKKMYVKPADRDFDPLEGGKGTSYPKKGSADSKSSGSAIGKAESGVSEAAGRRPNGKKVVEAAFDEPMDDQMDDGMGMDDQMDGGMNPESDVPPDMGDEGDEFGSEAGGGEEVAEDVTVEIAGQKYKLVPVEPEGDMGGEEGFEGGEEAGPDLGGEDFGPEAGDENAVGAEEDDLTKPQFEAAVRKALILKNKAERVLQELFTGAYVTNKQGDDVGMDFSMIGGDDEFSVKAPAASGKQYTPSFSVTDGNGMEDQKNLAPNPKILTKNTLNSSKKEGANSRKAAFAKWISEQQAKLNETGEYAGHGDQEDPGKTSDEFNKQDTFGIVSPRSPLDPERYPEIPEIVGSDEESITAYKQTQESRRKRHQESEQPVKFPSKSVKDDLENTLEEGFDFKALMAGKYSKKVQG